MTTAFSIRLARPDDAEAMTRVEDDAAQLYAAETSLAEMTIPASRTPQAYRTLIAKGWCIVAVADAKVIGFAACRAVGSELHLHELSVCRSRQERGIGRRLLYAVEADARASNFRAITLDTFRDVAWNAPFYARYGYIIVENFEGYPRLSEALDAAVQAGLPRDQRCAMIKFLN
jgi:predicted N-acetyltransferase YhbS